MISVVVASCLNHPKRKEFLLRTIEPLKRLIPGVEILIGFDKFGEEIEGCKCHVHENGLGGSFNWGIKEAKFDYILQIEDDWEVIIEEELLLSNLYKQIEVVKKYGGIFRLDNVNHDWWESGNTAMEEGGLSFLELNRPEEKEDYKKTLQFYYYSNHPHLKNKNLQEKVGYYKEGVPPHILEFAMCDDYLESKERVFFHPYNSFGHIGVWSARE
jgi:hypothetical protein